MTKYNYKIYQFKNDLFLAGKVKYAFERLSFAKELGFDESNPLKDYDLVYQDSFKVHQDDQPDENILEDLFETFNLARPEDFTGHSMSISDIVDLNGNLWYCDSFGFTRL